jgi:SnoaL-like domain
MKSGLRFSLVVSVCLLATGATGWSHEIPGAAWKDRNVPSERIAIEHVLSAYARALSDGDEAAFTSMLLNDQVPFTSTAELHLSKADPAHTQMSRYVDFKRAVFESGRQFKQRFYNVHIEQDGDLAQVSLDFVTREVGRPGGTYGWKALTLLKVAGHWKIAGELYTAYALPG